MSEPLLLIGGSVRAAAMSARRSGFRPLAIDRFADHDLREACDGCEQFTALDQIPELAGQFPHMDWFYTGPFENHADLIEHLADDRRLLGNHGRALRCLRDPQFLSSTLQKVGLPFPSVRRCDEPPAGSDWLVKPLCSAGGLGVRRISEDCPSQPEASYFQAFVPGVAVGATFVGANGRAALLGIAEQLLGPTWGGSREFQYVGSVGPLVLPPKHLRAVEDIGNCIAEESRISGLFGVDAILNDEGVWTIEVNPRYTASVEILERALDIAAIGMHVAACRHATLPEDTSGPPAKCVGKAVVYAKHAFVVDARLERDLLETRGQLVAPRIADIPYAGTSIGRGDPVATVLVEAATIDETKVALQQATNALAARLANS